MRPRGSSAGTRSRAASAVRKASSVWPRAISRPASSRDSSASTSAAFGPGRDGVLGVTKGVDQFVDVVPATGMVGGQAAAR